MAGNFLDTKRILLLERKWHDCQKRAAAGTAKLLDGAHLIHQARNNNKSGSLRMIDVTNAVALFDGSTGVINAR